MQKNGFNKQLYVVHLSQTQHLYIIVIVIYIYYQDVKIHIKLLSNRVCVFRIGLGFMLYGNAYK